MYLLYSILLAIGFILMLPMFLLRREKYASGFSQRLGNYPSFRHDGRQVIWLHCVSVGETNAARPLVDAMTNEFADYRLVISTTTKTGHELARKIFTNKADAIIYFPFDFKFSVRRALSHFKPSLVLLMETEIWPRFIHEAKHTGAKVAIVNGRLSQKSLDRYLRVRSLLQRTLADVDLALMQADADADRMRKLGIDPRKLVVTGNLKFEQQSNEAESALTNELRSRFALTPDRPLIIAASTHEREERFVIQALHRKLGTACRLMIAPRHPERFDAVAEVLAESKYLSVRRSASPSDTDKNADIILLDSIGELRSAYPLAEIVFVGGSLIPHGGQSVLEPAAAGRAIVTGPYTHNFESVIREFVSEDAIIQLPHGSEAHLQSDLSACMERLLNHPDERRSLGKLARSVVERNHGAASATINGLRTLGEQQRENS